MDEKGVWWDSKDPTYLQDRLKLRLIYRVRVVNGGTYPAAVSEWDSLDKFLREPDKCLWSLVYRKLKGKRGCTMIFPWEDEFLFNLIKNRNESLGLSPIILKTNEHITWDSDTKLIKIETGEFPEYLPLDSDHICEPEDPIIKLKLNSGSETHLQAYLTKNYGDFPESELIFGPTKTLKWLGNEVACGVGMQKIDLFAINKLENDEQFRLIELKKDLPDSKTVFQILRYIEWTKKFVKNANKDNIQPILLCRNLANIQLGNYIINSFNEFNKQSEALPLIYIECRAISKSVKFLKIWP